MSTWKQPNRKCSVPRLWNIFAIIFSSFLPKHSIFLNDALSSSATAGVIMIQNMVEIFWKRVSYIFHLKFITLNRMRSRTFSSQKSKHIFMFLFPVIYDQTTFVDVVHLCKTLATHKWKYIYIILQNEQAERTNGKETISIWFD